MIKAIRLRFIMTAMIAVTIILVIMTGFINVLNITASENHDKEILKELIATYDLIHARDAIAGGSFVEGMSEEEMETMPVQDRSEINRKANEMAMANKLLGAVHFLVEYNRNDELMNVDVDHIAGVSDEAAIEMGNTALERDDDYGKIQGFRYMRFIDPGSNSLYVFLDIDSSIQENHRIFLISILGGILCWLLLLIIVFFLSKQMIKPIAENMNKQKSFITDAGHELKTPLAIIQANTEAMEMINGENKWTNRIKEQTTRLSKLTNNLLLIAKAENYEEKPVIHEVDISSVIHEVLFMFEEAANNRGLEIIEKLDENIIVKGNRDRFSHMISLLIDNAVKYSIEGGKVFVSVLHTDNSAIIKIKNECVLPDCSPDQLFDRFFRPASSRGGNDGGSGIGLATAKAIVQLYGGNIDCRYEENSFMVFELKLLR